MANCMLCGKEALNMDICEDCSARQIARIDRINERRAQIPVDTSPAWGTYCESCGAVDKTVDWRVDPETDEEYSLCDKCAHEKYDKK